MPRLATLLAAAVVAAAAGCSPPDPFATAPRALDGASLPGHAPGPRAVAARTHGAYLVAFADAAGLHARLLADDGREIDRALGPGALVGAAGLDDGFAVAIAGDPRGGAGAIAVHFLDRDGADDHVTTVALPGRPLPYIASDGTRAIVGATTGGEIAIDTPRPLYATLAIVSPSAAPRTIDLGELPAPPSLWGDARGFVVAGRRLLDADGAMADAPGEQIAAARIFRQAIDVPRPQRDRVSLDGKRWLELSGLVACAASSGTDTLLAVDGELVRVGDDLTLRARAPFVAGSRLVAADATRLLVENQSRFAVLDAQSAAPLGAAIEIFSADPESISVALGSSDVFFAWNQNSVVRTARVIP